MKIFGQPVLTQVIGTYEKSVSQSIKLHAETLDQIVVVGLHNAYSALLLAKLYPNAHIIGVEANPSLCSDVKKTLKRNKIQNFELVECAVGYGKPTFSISGGPDGMVFKTESAVCGSDERSINPIVTLSHLLRRYCNLSGQKKSLLFVDIEGFEEDIVDNEHSSVFDYFDVVFVEWHSSVIKSKLLDAFLIERNGTLAWDAIEIKASGVRHQTNNGHLLFKKIESTQASSPKLT